MHAVSVSQWGTATCCSETRVAVCFVGAVQAIAADSPIKGKERNIRSDFSLLTATLHTVRILWVLATAAGAMSSSLPDVSLGDWVSLKDITYSASDKTAAATLSRQRQFW